MTRQKLITVLLICLSTLIAASASATVMTGRIHYCNIYEGIPDSSVRMLISFEWPGDLIVQGPDVTVQTNNAGNWSYDLFTPPGVVNVIVQFSFLDSDWIYDEFPVCPEYYYGSYCILRPCPKCPNFEDTGLEKDLDEETVVQFGAIKALYR